MYAIQGAIIGVGAILPGVSGGVLCVAFGLYEPLMELLTTPKKALKENHRMFVPFIVGWALGFVLLAKLIEMFFSFAPDVALFLFSAEPSPTFSKKARRQIRAQVGLHSLSRCLFPTFFFI